VRQVDLGALVQFGPPYGDLKPPPTPPTSIGTPSVRNLAESNSASFYLRPVIQADPSAQPGSWFVEGPPDTSTTPPSAPLPVHIQGPPLGSTQQVQLLLNEWGTASPNPASYTFDATAQQITPGLVTFTVSGVPSGVYLVRVRVDGAESAAVPDPVTNEFAAPWVQWTAP
jgi:hypothetical protein